MGRAGAVDLKTMIDNGASATQPVLLSVTSGRTYCFAPDCSGPVVVTAVRGQPDRWAGLGCWNACRNRAAQEDVEALPQLCPQVRGSSGPGGISDRSRAHRLKD